MDLVLFSGYARIPSNTTAQKFYEEMALVVTVDMNTGVIREAECTVVTELAKTFVRDLIVGYNMNNSIEPLTELVERHYQGHLRRALISSLRIIGTQYAEFKAKG